MNPIFYNNVIIFINLRIQCGLIGLGTLFTYYNVFNGY